MIDGILKKKNIHFQNTYRSFVCIAFDDHTIGCFYLGNESIKCDRFFLSDEIDTHLMVSLVKVVLEEKKKKRKFTLSQIVFQQQPFQFETSFLHFNSKKREETI